MRAIVEESPDVVLASARPMPHGPEDASHEPQRQVLEEWCRHLARDCGAHDLLVVHLVELPEPLTALALCAILFELALGKPLRALKFKMRPQTIFVRLPEGVLESLRGVIRSMSLSGAPEERDLDQPGDQAERGTP